MEVAKVLRVPAAFHLVRHLPKGSRSFVSHSKKADKSSMVQALALANGIFRQAAIAFDVDSFGFADVGIDLGVVANLTDGRDAISIRAKRSDKVWTNVFVVGELLNHSRTNGTTFEKKDVIIGDHKDGYAFAITLAHELGHVLTLGHVQPDPRTRHFVRKDGNVTVSHWNENESSG